MFKKAWETYVVAYMHEYSNVYIVWLCSLAFGALTALNSSWGWFTAAVVVGLLGVFAAFARCAFIVMKLRCPEGEQELEAMIARQEASL